MSQIITRELRRAAAVLAATAITTASASTASAQDGREALESIPLTVEALGINIRLPKGAVVVTEKIDGRVSVAISDAGRSPGWTMRINGGLPVTEGATAADQIESHLARLRGGAEIEVITSRPATYGRSNGHISYFKQTVGQSEPFAGCLLVLPRDDGSFLILSAVTLFDELFMYQPMLEASFGTISLRSTAESSLERRARLDRGRSLIDSVTMDRLQRFVGDSTWSRIYRRGPSGEEIEVGYSHITVGTAPRDVLSGHRTDGLSGEEEGLLVTVQGRVVQDPARSVYYDSLAQYWMAWDQSAETWSIRVTVRRDDQAQQSDAETGVRNPASPGEPRPLLTVIRSSDNARTREPSQWDVPDVYLSQALGWILGRLMPAETSESLDFAFYTYNFVGNEPSVTLRLDHWERENDGTGNFKLSTKLSSDMAPYVSTYAADGTFVQRVHTDGTITEPIEGRALEALWRAKGLQLGKSD